MLSVPPMATSVRREQWKRAICRLLSEHAWRCFELTPALCTTLSYHAARQ